MKQSLRLYGFLVYWHRALDEVIADVCDFYIQVSCYSVSVQFVYSVQTDGVVWVPYLCH